MIITLKGADFSKNNIGPLSSWLISREIGAGARYSGPVYVSKGGAFSATVVLAEGYTLDSAGVTVIMGGAAVTSGVTVDGNTITISIPSVTGSVVIKVPTKNSSTGEEEPETPETPTEYVSYLGTEYFTDVGQRVQWNESGQKWTDTHSGTTSAGTDLISVSSEDSIWISKIAVVNGSLASGGFYDMNKQLVAPLFWGTFGIDQAANASAKFVTPEAPATIASVEEAYNCSIAYVKFTAWAASDADNTGIETTEARVYYANGVPQEPTYTSYIGEDVFSFNKESFTDSGYTTSGSSSAYASDYLAVTPEQGVWLQYIFTMSNAHRCIGLFDSNKTFIKSITAADFGLSIGGKFQTPGAPVKISDLDGTENVAYVRFVAWTTSDGGRANTEARIYSY